MRCDTMLISILVGHDDSYNWPWDKFTFLVNDLIFTDKHSTFMKQIAAWRSCIRVPPSKCFWFVKWLALFMFLVPYFGNCCNLFVQHRVWMAIVIKTNWGRIRIANALLLQWFIREHTLQIELSGAFSVTHLIATGFRWWFSNLSD